MENEAVSSAKIAINLMVLSILIFIIIILVNVGKLNLMDAVNGIINTTNEERIRQFDEYDQKYVSGTKVLRALKVYEGTAFGIVYSTSRTRSPGNYAVNFGGVFQGASAYSGGYRISNFSAWKTKSGINDTFYTKRFQFDINGNVLRYENKNITRHSETNNEFIFHDGKFYAELIKDVSGETIGVCFTQD